jgi:hypothetical protein
VCGVWLSPRLSVPVICSLRLSSPRHFKITPPRHKRSRVSPCPPRVAASRSSLLSPLSSRRSPVLPCPLPPCRRLYHNAWMPRGPRYFIIPALLSSCCHAYYSLEIGSGASRASYRLLSVSLSLCRRLGHVQKPRLRSLLRRGANATAAPGLDTAVGYIYGLQKTPARTCPPSRSPSLPNPTSTDAFLERALPPCFRALRDTSFLSSTSVEWFARGCYRSTYFFLKYVLFPKARAIILRTKQRRFVYFKIDLHASFTGSAFSSSNVIFHPRENSKYRDLQSLNSCFPSPSLPLFHYFLFMPRAYLP